MGLSSTTCGMVTLKSPLSRVFSAPHVHPRLRKRLSRCTLDCGFQTAESPALRGFVGGPRALATAALYLVLLSNGPHRSKIQLIKFGFSPINTPANIAKKLPLQCCTKPLLIPFFNFSHKRPTFAFTSESGYTLGFRRKIAHKRLHAETGASPPSTTGWLVPPAKLPPKEQQEEADALLMACVRFLLYLSPAGSLFGWALSKHTLYQYDRLH